MREDVFEFPALERLIYGKAAAPALAAEAERIGGIGLQLDDGDFGILSGHGGGDQTKGGEGS